MPGSTEDKTYVFRSESSLEHYQADNFVVACVDDRFTRARRAFIKSLEIKTLDAKTPAGGAKVFSSPFEESDREYNLRELGISIKLHGVKKVMLFTHHDCGAYGGFSKFDNDPKKEFEYHRSEHARAIEVIKERFPQLEVESYFIDDKGIVKTY